MEEIYDTLRKITNTSVKIENIFFKDYWRSIDLPYNLNKTHFMCMFTIKHYGPSSMGFISNELCLEKGSFTIVAKKLINVGYVTKETDPSDKRSYILKLTDEGDKFISKVREQHTIYVDSKLERLTKPELKEFIKSLEKIDSYTSKL